MKDLAICREGPDSTNFCFAFGIRILVVQSFQKRFQILFIWNSNTSFSKTTCLFSSTRLSIEELCTCRRCFSQFGLNFGPSLRVLIIGILQKVLIILIHLKIELILFLSHRFFSTAKPHWTIFVLVEEDLTKICFRTFASTFWQCQNSWKCYDIW